MSFEADNDLEAVKYAADYMLTDEENQELMEILAKENQQVHKRSRSR